MATDGIIDADDVPQAKPWDLLQGTLCTRGLRIDSLDEFGTKQVLNSNINITMATIDIIESRTALTDPVTLLVSFPASIVTIATGYLLTGQVNLLTTTGHSNFVTIDIGESAQMNFNYVENVKGDYKTVPTYFNVLDPNINPFCE